MKKAAQATQPIDGRMSERLAGRLVSEVLPHASEHDNAQPLALRAIIQLLAGEPNAITRDDNANRLMMVIYDRTLHHDHAQLAFEAQAAELIQEVR